MFQQILNDYPLIVNKEAKTYILSLQIMSKITTEGKRRYDRKQRGYGGQTKPVFRKKVNLIFLSVNHGTQK